ncbi:MAG: glycosyl transferase [Salibacteraceae bacterium]|nr:glycosyl transferase [Salibacteraceae bacterium]
MKILYGIQGTGNGHISRALEIIPALQKFGEVDLLISGLHSELKLPFDVKFQFKGLGFVFGKKGGIDLFNTYKKNKLKRFYNEVKSLQVQDYDVVISDFEPVTAWACLQKQKPCLGLSNQVSLLNKKVPLAKSEDFVGKFIIKHYAPCSVNVGFSYESYDDHIQLPIIRQSIRTLALSRKEHYTVYLPSYSDEKIAAFFGSVKAEWQVFSKYSLEEYSIGNVHFSPLNKERFEASIASCKGIVTAAGFGTTTEALFMGKKLLVVPQKNQYEQACNAVALQKMGVPVIKSIKLKHLQTLQNWVENDEAISVNYPDRTEQLVQEALAEYFHFQDPYTEFLTHHQYQFTTT